MVVGLRFNVPGLAIVDSHRQAPVAGQPPLDNAAPYQIYPVCQVGYRRRLPKDDASLPHR